MSSHSIDYAGAGQRRSDMAFGLFMRSTTTALLVVSSVLVASVLAMPVRGWAQSPAEFYKGKNIDLLIGYSVGGAYDLYARLLARQMGKYIPSNPADVPKDAEGQGSLRLANWLYNVEAKDGSAFSIIVRGTS